MNLRNINKMKAEKGFTIVELLIVIVVIGILAAIIIVAYQGVTSRANTTKAKTNAVTVQKKAEAFATDTTASPGGLYPTTVAAFATSTLSALPTGLTLATATGSGAGGVSATNGTTTIRYLTCDSGAGYKISWWDYTAGAEITSGFITGGTTGTCTQPTS